MTNFMSSFARTMLSIILGGLLVIANAWVSASEVDNNQRDVAAMKIAKSASSQSTGQGYFASTVVYPAATRFVLSDIHPDSAWYSDKSQLVGKQATAVDCVDGTTHGIEEAVGRGGWYSACFKLDGDSFEYFIYGFKFVLSTPTTVVPSTTGTTGDCVADYSATGELHIPYVRVPGAFGRIETYDVWLKQRAGSFTFDLDTNRIQSK